MAKLVEILARELNEWPAEWLAVGQACDGSLHGEPFDGSHTGAKYTLCDRYIVDEVTRAEWQAAVDALKAKDAPEWGGVGLPPIGTACECDQLHGEWAKGEVIAHHWDGAIVAVGDNEKGFEYDSYQNNQVRPIRTPEQIAAEERDKARTEVLNAMTADGKLSSETEERWQFRLKVVGEMLDMGYRKQEPK